MGIVAKRLSVTAAVLAAALPYDVHAGALATPALVRVRVAAETRVCIETPLMASLRPARVRVVEWADRLAPVEVEAAASGPRALLRLYGSDGEIDAAALSAFAH